MPPAVSVLMTIFNAGPFLAPAVAGLLEQTFGDFELVAVENGSTDGSRQVLRGFAAADPRIRVVELDRNIGRTPALILALERAAGELVAVQDADDVSLPRRLELQVARLRSEPGLAVLGAWCGLIDAAGAAIGSFRPPVEPDEAYQALPHSNVVAHSAALYRRADALAVGGYPACYPFAQDYGLWVRLARLGGIANLAEELVLLRQQPGSMSVVPEHAVIRSLDAARIFAEAAMLPGLSAASRRAGRRAEALECGRLAKELVRSGRPLEAVRWGARGCRRDLGAFLAKLGGKYLLGRLGVGAA